MKEEAWVVAWNKAKGVLSRRKEVARFGVSRRGQVLWSELIDYMLPSPSREALAGWGNFRDKHTGEDVRQCLLAYPPEIGDTWGRLPKVSQKAARVAMIRLGWLNVIGLGECEEGDLGSNFLGPIFVTWELIKTPPDYFEKDDYYRCMLANFYSIICGKHADDDYLALDTGVSWLIASQFLSAALDHPDASEQASEEIEAIRYMCRRSPEKVLVPFKPLAEGVFVLSGQKVRSQAKALRYILSRRGAPQNRH